MTNQTAQEKAIQDKIDAAKREVDEANERRKELDRQLRWLKRAAPEIDAEIVRRVEAKDDGTRQWVAQLRQEATDAIWKRHEHERKEAEAEAKRKEAEAARIAEATAPKGPEQGAAKPQQ
ncbi:MAG: hypothetical protein Q4F65_13020 [Propionibacteriaceae bacterium]|nr:hypothetical protein [Propionibacteriaceae bacterium]